MLSSKSGDKLVSLSELLLIYAYYCYHNQRQRKEQMILHRFLRGSQLGRHLHPKMLPPCRMAFNCSSEQKNRTLPLQEEKLQRQQEVQHRKKVMEEHEIRMMRNKVQNTKGNFSPLISYLKLYRTLLARILMAFGVSLIAGLYFYVGGVHRDVFTDRKKIVLVSDSFEKAINQYLIQIVINQLCGLQSNEKASAALLEKAKEISFELEKRVGRRYKVVVISSEQHVLTVLPQSVIVSKNLLLSKGFVREEFMSLLMLMEGLFVKRWHIKQLALSNVMTFVMSRLKPDPVADLKLASIYSRRYSREEISQTIDEMNIAYALDSATFQGQIQRAIEGLRSSSKESSPFSLLNRLQSIIKI